MPDKVELEETVRELLGAAKHMRRQIAKLPAVPSSREFAVFLQNLQTMYTSAAAGWAGIKSVMTDAEIAASFDAKVRPMPADLDAAWLNIHFAGQAVYATFKADIWPVWAGKGYDLDDAKGLPVLATVTLPKSFTDAVAALDTALAQIANAPAA